jgi:hypothetical protein
MTSKVSTFSSFVANGHQALQYVSSSPSEIPDVGFSPVRLQTGIQPQPSLLQYGLSARPTSTRTSATYMRPKSFLADRRNNLRKRAFAQADLPSSPKDPPVQRPLARQRVMLSFRVIAYYGLIRNSRPLPSTYGLYDGSLPYGLAWAGIERLPNLLRVSPPSVPPSVPRRTEWLHLAVASPSILAFATSAQARHPHPHTRRRSCGKCNEAAKFALCYGPEESLAPHRQGRLRSSFHPSESPHSDVEYNYAGKQPIPAVPILIGTRYAALWAANRDTECTEKTFLFPERETALGKKQSLKSTSFSFPVSPGKEKLASLCDLCASSEAGGETPFLLQLATHNGRIHIHP